MARTSLERRRIWLDLVVAFCFGAGDQYLGTTWALTHVGVWSTDISALSAPWLAIAFIAGARQTRLRSALMMGAGATFAALVGYIVMTNSPIEGVSLSELNLSVAFGSQLHVLLPGLLTGPAFGWLGYRWRTERWLVSGLALAAIFLLEPIVKRAGSAMAAQLASPPNMSVRLPRSQSGR